VVCQKDVLSPLSKSLSPSFPLSLEYKYPMDSRSLLLLDRSTSRSLLTFMHLSGMY
jgi:hypothetical protein